MRLGEFKTSMGYPMCSRGERGEESRKGRGEKGGKDRERGERSDVCDPALFPSAGR
jgi:hypothetical protein